MELSYNIRSRKQFLEMEQSYNGRREEFLFLEEGLFTEEDPYETQLKHFNLNKKDFEFMHQPQHEEDGEIQYRLGYVYAINNQEKALEHFKKAAKQNHKEGLFKLAHCYLRALGPKGMTVNYEKAFKLYQLAANQGHASAQYWVAKFHEKGRATPVDHETAARLHKENREYPPSQIRLAYLYEKGLGVELNLTEAVRLYVLHKEIFQLNKLRKQGIIGKNNEIL